MISLPRQDESGTYSRVFFRNVPCSSSSNACRSCSCVFITIGPYQATGSSSGLPEIRRNRIPPSPACTVTSSPGSKSRSERLSAFGGGAVSAHPTLSVGTERGPDALQNFPAPEQGTRCQASWASCDDRSSPAACHRGTAK